MREVIPGRLDAAGVSEPLDCGPDIQIDSSGLAERRQNCKVDRDRMGHELPPEGERKLDL